MMQRCQRVSVGVGLGARLETDGVEQRRGRQSSLGSRRDEAQCSHGRDTVIDTAHARIKGFRPGSGKRC